MYFISSMLRVLKLDETIFQELYEKGLAFRYGHFNFIIVALIYGFSSIILIPYILEDYEVTELFITQGFVISTGIFIAFLFYLSATALLWAFSKGFGAEVSFGRVYANLGIALIPLWIAMPGLAAVMVGIEHYALYAYTVITTIYLIPTAFVATKNASSLSYGRMFLAFLVLGIFLLSFVYLWGAQHVN